MSKKDHNIIIPSRTGKVFWIAIIICAIIVAGTFNSLFSYFALALILAAIVLMEQKDALALMMMVMPFANIFKTAPEAQSFFTYLMLFYVLWHLVKSRTVYRRFIVALFLLVIYLIVQMTVSLNILRTIKFIVNILFVYLAVSNERDYDKKTIYLCYIIGLATSSAIIALNIFPDLINYVSIKEENVAGEQIARFGGMYGDPNYFSVNIIISLCLLVVLNHRKELSSLMTIGLACLLVLFVSLTASKSAFLMLFFPMLFLMYSKIKNKNYALFAGVAVISVFLIVQLLSGKISLFSNVLLRLDESADADALTTGRSYLWGRYMNYLAENPWILWFGKGFGADILGSLAAHNTYIDMLYYLGIVGTGFVVAVFYTMLNKNSEKPIILNYSVCLCVGIMYFFLSELFYFDWAFHIALAMLVFKTDMNQVKEV